MKRRSSNFQIVYAVVLRQPGDYGDEKAATHAARQSPAGTGGTGFVGRRIARHANLQSAKANMKKESQLAIHPGTRMKIFFIFPLNGIPQALANS
jgi:hypothetical protein